MIRLSEVKKSFTLQQKKLPILDIPSWQVEEGQRIALLGPSGSGKSTLLHLLSGVLAADSGEITAAGHDLHRCTEAERDRYRAACVGYILQDFPLLASLSARQNVELVLPPGLGKRECSRLIEAWFAKVGLAERMNHMPHQLSRGQLQRVAIVRALINKPKLVLADEPTGSLDWETAGETMTLLLTLCEAERLTLITVTHDLHLAALYPLQTHMSDINRAARLPEGARSGGEGGAADEHPAAALA